MKESINCSVKNEISEFKSSLISKNITVLGRRTSVRLEPEMWLALKEISSRETCSIHDICTLVSMRKASRSSLTAAIRVFLMLYFRSAATEEGHKRAGHGNFTQMLDRAKINTFEKSDKNLDRKNYRLDASEVIAVQSSKEIYSARI